MDAGLAVVVAGMIVGIVAVIALLMTRWLRTAAKGTALIVSGGGPTRVVFDRVLAIPVIHAVEVLDLSLQTVVIDRRGREGLHCHDNVRADVRAAFLIRVNHTAEDVLKVADTIGCARAGDPAALTELFADKFAEALRTVVKHFRFEDGARRGDELKDQVIEVVGRDLNGWLLEDVAIETFEQTPIEMLDPNNILDAEGIRLITERVSEQKIKANEIKRRMETEIARMDLAAAEDRAFIERTRAESAARAT